MKCTIKSANSYYRSSVDQQCAYRRFADGVVGAAVVAPVVVVHPVGVGVAAVGVVVVEAVAVEPVSAEVVVHGLTRGSEI